ncbi:hypothetical protein DES53_104276 [Roseimicrobium gellanilyticum]|uniref:Uncharacterized protein n=1 Tax=Roseimicrobium gellanilyticum TaxID=748857 RepID=A0A366HPE4_9BACT|nr:hypothetical protein [Roseimicrobium gellanilyticum]RBP44455.1 hypothetical protein DES53_104276 [Roseimicrobium gellanilyticum]
MPAPTPSRTPQDVPRLTPSRTAELEMMQPFGHDVCAYWRDAVHDSEVPMNEGALQSLRVLESEGRVTLLNAPRAGHGKTHLLGRVARRLQEEAIVAGLPWTSLEGLGWSASGRGILQDLARAGKNPTLLQRVGGGVLATMLRRLIQTGRIPSTDPVQALRVLSQDPMDLFLEGKSASVIGSWFRRHFEQLAKPLAECAGPDGSDAMEGWLRGLFHYLENPSATAVVALESRLERDGAAEISRLIRLITAWKPLVLVADHMDGMYRDPEAGVAIARMALAFVSMPGVHVVLSMNQDLWETTFGGQLPSALEDRLNSYSVPLRGPTPQEAHSLITLRLQDAGVAEDHARGFLNFLDLDRFFYGRAVGSVSARGLLRHATQTWRHWLAAGAPLQAPQSPPATMPLQGRHQPQPEMPLPDSAGGFLLEDMPSGASAPESAAEVGKRPVPSLPPPAAELPAPKEQEAEAFPSLTFDDESDAEDDEALKKLAEHLAQDSGGRVVDLSTGPGSLPPAGPTPPQVINIVPVRGAATPSASERSTPPPLPPQPAATPPPAEVGLNNSAADQVPDATATEAGEGSSFQRLRHALARIKLSAGQASVSTDPNSYFRARDTQRVPTLEQAHESGHLQPATNGAAATSASIAAALPQESAPVPPDQMLSRFESARQEISRSGRAAQIELPVLGDLVRLAGKRFPVVNYDEIELPGLLGRSVPRWTLQGMEIVFGLEDYGNTRYWRTISAYVVGRLAELQVLAMQSGETPPQLKLTLFKGDLEGPGLAALFTDEVIPAAMRHQVDAVHLDARDLASLYAMHQLVRDTETGTMQVDANTVLGALANELDFFWKRLTRPKGS